MDRKLYKGGKYSLVLSIPKTLLKALGWRSGQFVKVTNKGKKLTVQDAYSRESNRRARRKKYNCN